LVTIFLIHCTGLANPRAFPARDAIRGHFPLEDRKPADPGQQPTKWAKIATPKPFGEKIQKNDANENPEKQQSLGKHNLIDREDRGADGTIESIYKWLQE
jgi:hypothetical protein